MPCVWVTPPAFVSLCSLHRLPSACRPSTTGKGPTSCPPEMPILPQPPALQPWVCRGRAGLAGPHALAIEQTVVWYQWVWTWAIWRNKDGAGGRAGRGAGGGGIFRQCLQSMPILSMLILWVVPVLSRTQHWLRLIRELQSCFNQSCFRNCHFSDLWTQRSVHSANWPSCLFPLGSGGLGRWEFRWPASTVGLGPEPSLVFSSRCSKA